MKLVMYLQITERFCVLLTQGHLNSPELEHLNSLNFYTWNELEYEISKASVNSESRHHFWHLACGDKTNGHSNMNSVDALESQAEWLWFGPVSWLRLSQITRVSRVNRGRLKGTFTSWDEFVNSIALLATKLLDQNQSLTNLITVVCKSSSDLLKTTPAQQGNRKDTSATFDHLLSFKKPLLKTSEI